MTADSNPNTMQIESFGALNQMKLFQTLKQNHFSGQLCLRNVRGLEWILFIYLGRIVYATGGKHPVRRWRRNLATHLPQIAKRLQQELQEIDLNNTGEILLTWDYHLLDLWVKQRKIDLEQVTKYIRSLTGEILFDLTQENKISFYLVEQPKSEFQPLAMIDAQQQIDGTKKLWQKWQELSFETILPDLAPKIINPQALKESTSEKAYQAIVRLLDGRHSIRDLAVQKQTDSLTFLRSIYVYLQLGDIQLIEIPDIAYPIAISENTTKKPSNIEEKNRGQKLLIACIALSPVMNQLMAKVTTVAGYEFISENDSLQAMPMLLARKPDLIFLDIELPGLNGYEICTELRQLDSFNKTPIILFGRNITLIERMKTKMSGASELFQQSMDIKFLLNLIKKYSLSLEKTNDLEV